MKKIISLMALAILLIAFATCTENDLALVNPEEEEGIPEPTPVGTPVGDMVTKQIGPDGGSISAIDNTLKLVIPAGALDATTAITVQPITNFAPGGVGNAYELSPDGQRFSKPVSITFHYMDSVEGGATWSEIGIAFQDANGFWHRAQNIVSDSVNKTISATSLHFTGFSIYRNINITPIHSVVHLKKNVVLYFTVAATKDNDELIYLAPLKGLTTTWMVEGIVNGNASVGKISTQSNTAVVATYTAPDKVPANNLLQIKVHIRGPKFDISRFAFIKVVGDEWHFTLELGEGHGIVSKSYSYDKALLDIDILKDVVTFSNIRNFAPQPTSVTETILLCTHTLSGGAIGQINIVSAKGTVNPNGLLMLEFTHSGARYPTFTQQCPEGPAVTTGGESFSGSPSYENFEIKEGVQLHGIEKDIYWAKLTPR